MKARFLMLLALLCGGVALRGQGGVSAATQAKLVQNQAAKDNARDSLKAGNQNSAVAQLRSGLKKGDGGDAGDIEVVGALCSLANSLTAELHPAGRDTALLAVSEASKAKGKLPRAEAAYLDAQIGGLYESILGDRNKAREQYQSALAQDATRKDAAEGLRRIARLEALLQEKARENAALRSRGK